MTVAVATHSQVSAAELASFTRQLGAMLDAGVDVLRALRIASQHSKNPHLMEAARSIARRLEDGREFHTAITPHPDIFDPFYVEMARQGETDGLLGKALLSVADYLDRVAQQQAASPSAPAPTAGHFPVVSTMAVLGVQAVGAAVIWSVATARPEILPIVWLGPLAALWAGVCLLSGSWILMRIRQPRSADAVLKQAETRLPAKDEERKRAEAEGLARSALAEQREEQEESGLRRISAGSPAVSPNGSNGRTNSNGSEKPAENALEPSDEPPRFQL